MKTLVICAVSALVTLGIVGGGITLYGVSHSQSAISAVADHSAPAKPRVIQVDGGGM